MSLLDHEASGSEQLPCRQVVVEDDTVALHLQSQGLLLQKEGRSLERQGSTGDSRVLRKVLQEQDPQLVQDSATSTLRFSAELSPNELILLGIRYEEPWRSRGSVEACTATDGSGTSEWEEAPLRGRYVRIWIDVPPGGADRIEIRHQLPPQTRLPVRSVTAFALPNTITAGQKRKAELFLKWLSHNRGLVPRAEFDMHRMAISRDGMTAECLLLTDGESREFALPARAKGRTLRFSLAALAVPRSSTAALTVEVGDGQIWKSMGQWTMSGKNGQTWIREELPIGQLPRDAAVIRFRLTGKNTLIALGDPLFLAHPEAPAERMNVIVIDLDTLRADRMQCCGYEKRPTTAKLDQLLREKGFSLFRNANAASSWTVPSTAQFLTSRYLGFETVGDLGREHEALAEILRARGYFCAAFTGGGALCTPGFSQGFHEFHWSDGIGKVEEVFPGAAEWLDGRPGGPFFLFLHTYETHRPYTRDLFCEGLDSGRLGDLTAGEQLLPSSMTYDASLSPKEKEYVNAAYDSGVRWATDAAADFLRRLDSLDLWENTLVIILSDHGEELWDHMDLFAIHGHSLYGELLQVPFILRAPGMGSGDLMVLDDEISLVDLVPTVLDFLDIEQCGNLDGESVRPLINGNRVKRKIPVLAVLQHQGYRRTCIIENRMKYIEPRESRSGPANWVRKGRNYPPDFELYDLSSDPRERSNVYHDSDRSSQEMREKLALALASARDPVGGTDAHTSFLEEGLRRQLKELGYVEDVSANRHRIRKSGNISPPAGGRGE